MLWPVHSTPLIVFLCVLFFSVLHPNSFLCLDWPAFFPICTYNKRHKHLFLRRDSNPQPQLGHWNRHGIRSPDRTARSESLYRLSYLGPQMIRYSDQYVHPITQHMYCSYFSITRTKHKTIRQNMYSKHKRLYYGKSCKVPSVLDII